jgi:Xaa-Pro aminopeptidase
MKRLNLDVLIANEWSNCRYIVDLKVYFEADLLYDGYAVILSQNGEFKVFGPWLEGKFVGGYSKGGYGFSLPGWKSYPFISATVIADQWAKLYSKMIKELNADKGRVGIDVMHAPIYMELKKTLPDVEFIPIFDKMLEIRSIKSAEEIALHRKAAEIGDIGLEAGLDMIREGVTEYEVTGKILDAMFSAGSEYEPFVASVCSGPEADHYFSSSRTLRKGDLVSFDIGSVAGGYISDQMRTGCVGEPSKQAREMYTLLYNAYWEGVKKIRPGVSTIEIDKAIRTPLIEAGYPDFEYSVGHGVGLRTQDLPFFAREGDYQGKKEWTTLKPGMILALEPKISKVGVGSVGLEDTILVTETGYEVLNKTHHSESLLMK